MSSYTPGPWYFSKWEQFGNTSFYIAQQEGAPYTPNYSDVATLIAETCTGEKLFVQEANAALIAAAPEMYEMLQQIYTSSAYTEATEWLPMAEIKALLAKARGEAV